MVLAVSSAPVEMSIFPALKFTSPAASMPVSVSVILLFSASAVQLPFPSKEPAIRLTFPPFVDSVFSVLLTAVMEPVDLREMSPSVAVMPLPDTLTDPLSKAVPFVTLRSVFLMLIESTALMLRDAVSHVLLPVSAPITTAVVSSLSSILLCPTVMVSPAVMFPVAVMAEPSALSSVMLPFVAVRSPDADTPPVAALRVISLLAFILPPVALMDLAEAMLMFLSALLAYKYVLFNVRSLAASVDSIVMSPWFAVIDVSFAPKETPLALTETFLPVIDTFPPSDVSTSPESFAMLKSPVAVNVPPFVISIFPVPLPSRMSFPFVSMLA